MRISFSYPLLITWFLIAVSCNTQYFYSHTEARNIAVTDSVTALDSQIVRMYLPYKQDIDREMSRVVGITAAEMVKDKPESELTNFLADLLLEEGHQELTRLGKNFAPDISFFNYGGIRTFLPQGEITVGKVFELMPFENEMVFVKLSGIQVREFLDNVASKGGDSVGGVRFSISQGKATDIVVNGEPVSDDRDYWLVTNDYVAAGGDGLDVFSNRKDFVQAGFKIRDAIIRHLEKHHSRGEVISVNKDGRISHRVN